MDSVFAALFLGRPSPTEIRLAPAMSFDGNEPGLYDSASGIGTRNFISS